MKKIISILLTLVMALGTMSVSFAATEGVAEDDDYNYIYVDSYDDINWSTATENDIFIFPNDESDQQNTDGQLHNLTEISKTRGHSMPRKGWNIAENGMCTFDGYSNDQPLITEYYFYGLTKYRVYVKNNLKQKTNAEVLTLNGKKLAGFSIPANSTATKIFSTSSTSVEFCVSFDYACNVTGNVGTGKKK